MRIKRSGIKFSNAIETDGLETTGYRDFIDLEVATGKMDTEYCIKVPAQSLFPAANKMMGDLWML